MEFGGYNVPLPWVTGFSEGKVRYYQEQTFTIAGRTIICPCAVDENGEIDKQLSLIMMAYIVIGKEKLQLLVSKLTATQKRLAKVKKWRFEIVAIGFEVARQRGIENWNGDASIFLPDETLGNGEPITVWIIET